MRSEARCRPMSRCLPPPSPTGASQHASGSKMKKTAAACRRCAGGKSRYPRHDRASQIAAGRSGSRLRCRDRRPDRQCQGQAARARAATGLSPTTCRRRPASWAATAIRCICSPLPASNPGRRDRRTKSPPPGGAHRSGMRERDRERQRRAVECALCGCRTAKVCRCRHIRAPTPPGSICRRGAGGCAGRAGARRDAPWFRPALTIALPPGARPGPSALRPRRPAWHHRAEHAGHGRRGLSRRDRVLLINHGDAPFPIRRGERIAPIGRRQGSRTPSWIEAQQFRRDGTRDRRHRFAPEAAETHCRGAACHRSRSGLFPAGILLRVS